MDLKMTFEEALPLLKNGKKVVRTGWSGAEQFVKLYDSLAVKKKDTLPVTPRQTHVPVLN
jgi:hypothetical protein